MSSLLSSILEAKRQEVVQLRARGVRPSARVRAPRPLDAALRRPEGAPLRLMLEHKRKSPSGGVLSGLLSPAARARAYAEAGAAAVSVLTDAPFFGGSYDDLAAVHGAIADTPTLLLAKEFVIDERQIDEAFAAGADAVLLIVRLLDDPRLAALHARTREHGMQALFEVVDEIESERAYAAGAEVIGVNARDLDTLAMDPARAARTLAALRDVVPVHLSGLRSADDVGALARGPAHAALAGEALMRQDDPRPLLAEFFAAAGAAR